MKRWKVTFKAEAEAIKREGFLKAGWERVGTYPANLGSIASIQHLDVWEYVYTSEGKALECYTIARNNADLQDVTLHVADWKLVLPA